MNFQKKINIVLFLSLSFFLVLLFFVFYKSEIQYKGLSRENFFLYYIVFIAFNLIIFCSIVFKKYRSLFLLIFISIFISLYILELIISNRIFEKIRLKSLDANFDTRSLKEIILQDWSNDIESSFTITPGIYYDDDYDVFGLSGGISNVLTYEDIESGEYSKYTSDRYGFRNDDNLWDQKVDIILIGDSFVQGFAVQEGENISETFNENSNYLMINLGIGGSGAISELARLREYIGEIDADYVFWVYQESNDLASIDDEVKSKTLMKYLKNYDFTQDLINKQNLINKQSKEYLVNLFNSRGYNLKKFLKLNSLRDLIALTTKYSSWLYDIRNDDPLLNKKRINVLEEVLLAAKHEAEKNNMKFIFVYGHVSHRYSISNHQDINFRLKDDVIELAKKLKFTIIDLDSELMSKEENPYQYYPFNQDGHPNAKGYKLVSDFLIKKFDELKINKN